MFPESQIHIQNCHGIQSQEYEKMQDTRVGACVREGQIECYIKKKNQSESNNITYLITNSGCNLILQSNPYTPDTDLTMKRKIPSQTTAQLNSQSWELFLSNEATFTEARGMINKPIAV